MRNQRMVSLGALPPFQARLLAARLGAEGILWQLRGESSIYPFGGVEVLVEESGIESARELLGPHPAEDLPGEAADGGSVSGDGACEVVAVPGVCAVPEVFAMPEAFAVDALVASAPRRAGSRRPLQFVVWLTLLLMIAGLVLRVAHVG